MHEFGVILFHTTSVAFKTEKLLKGAKLQCKLVPTPRELSSDCGLAARFNWRDKQRVAEVLEDESVEHAGVHPMPGDR